MIAILIIIAIFLFFIMCVLSAIRSELEKTRLENREIYLNFEDDSKKFLLNKGIDIENGARPLRRIIIKEVEDRLSEEILQGNIKIGDKVKVSELEDKLVFSKLS